MACSSSCPTKDHFESSKSKAYRAKWMREHRKKNPEHYLDLRMRNRYGISLPQYEALLEAQGGGCAICGTTDPATPSGRFPVDHDHACCPGEKSCGKCVRGLLCNRCNAAIAMFQDRADLMEKGASYVLGRQVLDLVQN